MSAGYAGSALEALHEGRGYLVRDGDRTVYLPGHLTLAEFEAPAPVAGQGPG